MIKLEYILYKFGAFSVLTLVIPGVSTNVRGSTSGANIFKMIGWSEIFLLFIPNNFSVSA